MAPAQLVVVVGAAPGGEQKVVGMLVPLPAEPMAAVRVGAANKVANGSPTASPRRPVTGRNIALRRLPSAERDEVTPVDTTEGELLGQVARAVRQFASGIITAEEFTDKWADCLTYPSGLPVHLAPELVALMPEPVRAVVRQWAAAALHPDYRKGAWHGGRARAPEERAAESAMLTARARTWAVAISRALSTLG